MRRGILPAAVVCLLLSAVAGAARPWWIEVEWGQRIPGGTVYTVTIDSDGKLHAERKGMPSVPTKTHERMVPGESAARIRTTGEQFIRQLNFDETQGKMMADGGYASVYVHDGSATLGAHLGLLASWDESGKAWKEFLALLTPLLPKDFIE